MDPQKENKLIPFLLGLFMGWTGVRIGTHIFYLSIISMLVGCLILKK